MSLFQLWLLGFSCSMALIAWQFWRHRDKHKSVDGIIAVAIGAIIVSAAWPLTLLAILVAVNEE